MYEFYTDPRSEELRDQINGAVKEILKLKSRLLDLPAEVRHAPELRASLAQVESVMRPRRLDGVEV